VKRALQFGAALIAAVLFHLVGVRLIAEWALILDLMLIVVVFNALRGKTLAAMIGGLVAGWATDALTGSTFGIFGLVDTIVGYGAAYSVQRIVIQRPAGAALLFALAAACQQGLVLVLSLLLLSDLEIPAYHWLVIRAGATGLLGAVVFYLRLRVTSQLDLWRHTRRTRIRLEK
jgi:rod shape-determining protein MreD